MKTNKKLFLSLFVLASLAVAACNNGGGESSIPQTSSEDPTSQTDRSSGQGSSEARSSDQGSSSIQGSSEARSSDQGRSSEQGTSSDAGTSSQGTSEETPAAAEVYRLAHGTDDAATWGYNEAIVGTDVLPDPSETTLSEQVLYKYVTDGSEAFKIRDAVDGWFGGDNCSVSVAEGVNHTVAENGNITMAEGKYDVYFKLYDDGAKVIYIEKTKPHSVEHLYAGMEGVEQRVAFEHRTNEEGYNQFYLETMMLNTITLSVYSEATGDTAPAIDVSDESVTQYANVLSANSLRVKYSSTAETDKYGFYFNEVEEGRFKLFISYSGEVPEPTAADLYRLAYGAPEASTWDFGAAIQGTNVDPDPSETTVSEQVLYKYEAKAGEAFKIRNASDAWFPTGDNCGTSFAEGIDHEVAEDGNITLAVGKYDVYFKLYNNGGKVIHVEKTKPFTIEKAYLDVNGARTELTKVVNEEGYNQFKVEGEGFSSTDVINFYKDATGDEKHTIITTDESVETLLGVDENGFTVKYSTTGSEDVYDLYLNEVVEGKLTLYVAYHGEIPEPTAAQIYEIAYGIPGAPAWLALAGEDSETTEEGVEAQVLYKFVADGADYFKVIDTDNNVWYGSTNASAVFADGVTHVEDSEGNINLAEGDYDIYFKLYEDGGKVIYVEKTKPFTLQNVYITINGEEKVDLTQGKNETGYNQFTSTALKFGATDVIKVYNAEDDELIALNLTTPDAQKYLVADGDGFKVRFPSETETYTLYLVEVEKGQLVVYVAYTGEWSESITANVAIPSGWGITTIRDESAVVFVYAFDGEYEEATWLATTGEGNTVNVTFDKVPGKFIVVRCPAGTTTGSWDTEWHNQTDDITFVINQDSYNVVLK